MCCEGRNLSLETTTLGIFELVSVGLAESGSVMKENDIEIYKMVYINTNHAKARNGFGDQNGSNPEVKFQRNYRINVATSCKVASPWAVRSSG